MKFPKSIICLVLLLFTQISIVLAAADCLSNFQNDMASASDNHELLLSVATTQVEVQQADAIYNDDVTNAVNSYDDCCNNGIGNSGCP